jgi:hypothetical protein
LRKELQVVVFPEKSGFAGTKTGFYTLYLPYMKKLLATWFALSLALNPVAGAFASSMMDMSKGSKTESHCPGHAAQNEQPQDTQMDCCPSDADSNQCCDHCVTTLSGLLNTHLLLAIAGTTDLIVSPVRTVPSKTNSPPYKPPQA